MTNNKEAILLTEDEVFHSTIECLAEHIYLDTSGACTSQDLFQILVKAASNCDSIENTTKGFQKSPCGKTLRNHFNKINNFTELEHQLNSALISQILPSISKGKRLTLAIKGVKPTDTSVAIITYLLDAIYSLDINIKTLYLDRGFFSISVIRWLKA